MLSHGYIKNDFDVDEWAAPEFLEKAAQEVIKEEWKKRSWCKLPEGTEVELSTHPRSDSCGGLRLGARHRSDRGRLTAGGHG